MKKLLIVVLILTAVVGVTYAQDGSLEIEGGEIFAEGFNGPMGITVDPDGNVWVVDSGVAGDEDIQWVSPDTGQAEASKIGDTSRVVMIAPDGTQTEVATLPSIAAGSDILGGARLVYLDGSVYVTSGQWIEGNGSDRQEFMGAVVKVDMDGTKTEVANTWAIEEASNIGGFVLDSHPYGITVGPEGWLWVADAGGNSLLHINPAGEPQYAAVGFEGVPGPFPNAARGDAMETDPVPTAVAFDADGTAYVSLLPGFPFLAGSSKVVKVSEEGVVDYATGLAMTTDLKTAPDGGMYAVQFAVFTEQGPTPNSGAIIRVLEGDASEVVVSGLPFPTSIAFDADGNAYVTVNGVGAPGSGAVVKFAGLTDMEGSPISFGE